MKVKEIDRTANIAWSPAAHHPIYLAAGTAAQQLDATFSTTAALEIYALNLTEPGLDMCMKGSVVSDFRFHALSWGKNGVLVGGADGGNLLMYDAQKLLQGDDPILHHSTKHSGSVHSLDFNNFQDCLLASGASESEIFIWDLNKPGQHVTLGAKSQPLEQVSCVSWNCQVQHILASAFPARCVIWDLRKNEPVIKVADSAARLRCKVVCWHPEVATQLCLASEDDLSPVIQLWDLRFATSPLKTLQQHQRGVLSLAWCPQDPDLLLSCGKDNRILCWNPNSNVPNGEVVCELCSGGQWSFDVAWCPRNPALIASASCDGQVGVFSLMGGQQQTQPSSKIAESFPGTESMGSPPESIERVIPIPLQRPPKWLRKPAGAAFGFGGRLVSLVEGSKTVRLSHVITEPELVEKARQLELALNENALQDFCAKRSETDPQNQMTWRFLQAIFSPSVRSDMLRLLGYDSNAVSNELKEVLKDQPVENSVLNDDFSNLSVGSGDFLGSAALPDEPIRIEADANDPDSLVTRALLTGNISGAVDLCVEEGRWADALVLSQAGGIELQEKTQKRYFASVKNNTGKLVSSVVTGEWSSLVQQCDIKCWKEVFAAILTWAKGEEFPQLCELLGRRLEADPELCRFASLCYIGAFNLESLARWWVKSRGGDSPTSKELQGLIEQVMILRCSGAANTTVESGGVLCGLLAHYASQLAAQGSLESAENYLLDPNEFSLSVLHDRIRQSLGQRSPGFPFQRVNVRRDSSQVQQVQAPSAVAAERRRSSASSMQQQQYSYGMSPPQQQPPTSFAYNTSPPSMYQPMPVSPPMITPNPPISNLMQPVGAPPTMMVPTQPPVAPPMSEPPPPMQEVNKTRQNSGSGMSHLSHRYPKHLHDPSVYSENPYHQPQNQFYQPNFMPQQPQQQTQQPYYTPSVPSSFPSTQPVSTFTPQQQPTPPLSQPPVSAYQNAPVYSECKPGWNDPPLIKQQPSKPGITTYETSAPITRPFPDVPEPEPVAPSGGYFVPQYNAPYGATPPMQPAQEMAPPPQKVCEPVREKGPIPPEHQVLQDTFEDLRRQCQRVATNPQTRRKLDDVAKKLENLYDKLRESTISSNVSMGLHQISQYATQGDYPSALAIHGQTVASANFTETSGFMPSLKVLLQTASQLQVSLR